MQITLRGWSLQLICKFALGLGNFLLKQLQPTCIDHFFSFVYKLQVKTSFISFHYEQKKFLLEIKMEGDWG